MTKQLSCFLFNGKVVVWGEIEIQPPFSAPIVTLVIDSLPAESHALHPRFAFILKSNNPKEHSLPGVTPRICLLVSLLKSK